MALQGKGYFIWRIPACENGNVSAIVTLASQAQFTHVLIKVADGAYSYNLTSSGTDLVPPLISALKAKGISCWGWHYIYGNYPVNEADKAIQRIRSLKLDGYALDVEAEYKQSGKSAAASTFMTRLRNAYPNLPVALCSYRFPTYHPQIPWKVFLDKCDYNMPQVYWEQAHNPADQLLRCVQEFQAMTPFRPIIPVGSAYRSGSWSATPEEVLQFMIQAQTLNLSAANFWEWSNTRKYVPTNWDMVSQYPWSSGPPTPDITTTYFAELNSHDPVALAALYLSSGVHVNSARTVQGATAITSWYQSLFNSLLPNATFTRTSLTVNGSARYFTWTATSSKGKVNDGSDVLGLYNGQIAYHYTYFNIT